MTVLAHDPYPHEIRMPRAFVLCQSSLERIARHAEAVERYAREHRLKDRAYHPGDKESLLQRFESFCAEYAAAQILGMPWRAHIGPKGFGAPDVGPYGIKWPKEGRGRLWLSEVHTGLPGVFLVWGHAPVMELRGWIDPAEFKTSDRLTRRYGNRVWPVWDDELARIWVAPS